jgi:hypothetical protein
MVAPLFIATPSYLQPWQTVDVVNNPAIGRFEGREFDPAGWKPRVPTAAFLRARPDDTFWAARRVMAFSDEMIRAIAATGQYSDPAAATLLADVLIQRRDTIGRAYLNAVNPVVNAALGADGTLTFDNAAVMAAVGEEPAGGYTAAFFRFDNATGETAPLGAPVTATAHRITPPAALPAAAGSYVKVDVAAVKAAQASWAVPVQLYFRRAAGGWTLVGVER